MASENVGVEAIDFGVSETLDHLEEAVKRWKGWLNENHHPPLSIHGPFLDLNPVSYDSQIAKTTWLRFSQAYQAALALGADKIIFHSCRVPLVNYPQGWAERMAEFWQRFLEKHSELDICMENVFDEDPALFLKVIQNVRHPRFSLCLDAAHAHCFSPVPVREWVGMLGPYIGHVHVHDNLGDKDSHLAVGDGSLPWDDILPKLRRLSPSAAWTIENTKPEDIQKSLVFLKNCL